MCGRLNLTNTPGVQTLLNQLEIDLWPEPFDQRFVRATNQIPIVIEQNNQRQQKLATWWLLLEPTETSFKPSKYTSFNTRYDKLNVPRSAGYIPFRQSRCIIPAAGFGETEFINKKPIHYYDFEAVPGEAIAFGGLYKEWINKNSGEVVFSCSVITLPPHNKLKHIHSKASPLILPQDPNLLDSWLDPMNQNTDMFNSLLSPNLPQDLNAYPIDKPSTFIQMGNTEFIGRD